MADLTRTAVLLAEMREQLPVFADIPFPGYTLSGSEIADSLSQLTGAQLRLKRMSWLALQLAHPFWRMAPSLLEMRYLWEVPHRLDGTLFASLLPEFRATPLTEALATAIPESLERVQSSRIHPPPRTRHGKQTLPRDGG